MESKTWNPLCQLDAGGFLLYIIKINKRKDTMINEDNQNALDFVRASNKDKLYQATLKEVQTNLSEEVQNKVKDMLKTKSPEQVKQAIYLFFRS